MSPDAMKGGCGTMSTVESRMLEVCTLQFPTGAVGAFKLLLDDAVARLVVDDGKALHGITAMAIDPARTPSWIAIRLLLSAVEASAHRTGHFDLLTRCRLLHEGLIDVNIFRGLAARIATCGVIRRAMRRSEVQPLQEKPGNDATS